MRLGCVCGPSLYRKKGTYASVATDGGGRPCFDKRRGCCDGRVKLGVNLVQLPLVEARIWVLPFVVPMRHQVWIEWEITACAVGDLGPCALMRCHFAQKQWLGKCLGLVNIQAYGRLLGSARDAWLERGIVWCMKLEMWYGRRRSQKQREIGKKFPALPKALEINRRYSYSAVASWFANAQS